MSFKNAQQVMTTWKKEYWKPEIIEMPQSRYDQIKEVGERNLKRHQNTIQECLVIGVDFLGTALKQETRSHAPAWECLIGRHVSFMTNSYGRRGLHAPPGRACNADLPVLNDTVGQNSMHG
ncbi:hypothetical protein WDW89_18025 [Deltaproteobacteria bacterium TL4]